jgi:hypothetical protein
VPARIGQCFRGEAGDCFELPGRFQLGIKVFQDEIGEFLSVAARLQSQGLGALRPNGLPSGQGAADGQHEDYRGRGGKAHFVPPKRLAPFGATHAPSG